MNSYIKIIHRGIFAYTKFTYSKYPKYSFPQVYNKMFSSSNIPLYWTVTVVWLDEGMLDDLHKFSNIHLISYMNKANNFQELFSKTVIGILQWKEIYIWCCIIWTMLSLLQLSYFNKFFVTKDSYQDLIKFYSNYKLQPKRMLFTRPKNALSNLKML